MLIFCGIAFAPPAFGAGFKGQKTGAALWGVAQGKGYAVAVGEDGALFLTEGEKSWRRVSVRFAPFLLSVDVVLRNTIVAVGSAGGLVRGEGLILRSTNRGRTFAAVGKTAAQPFYAVKFVNAKISYAAGVGGALSKTIDGGKKWRRLKTGTRANFWAIHFFNGRVGLIGGGDTPWQNNGKNSGIILRTTNGGKSWRSVHRSQNRISDFAFVNAKIGYAGGVNGVLLKSADGGVSWRQIARTPLSAIINAVEFVTEECGVIVGAGGAAYVTKDGGKSWPIRIKVTDGSFIEDLDPSGPGGRPSGFLTVAGNGTVGRIEIGKFCAP
ncbi:MAG: YCF48-related protein [Proteobacteria bacterium]|nr:YCF48-related protein [Pseudomonadota bacterium]